MGLCHNTKGHFSHTRLWARDHYTSSTFIGGKGGAGPSLLHTTLEGPTGYVCECKMGVKFYMEFYMVSNGSCFVVTWIVFKNHLLEGGLTQNWVTMVLGTLTTVGLFYFFHVWGSAWIKCYWHRIWLRVQLHMSSLYTWESVTTLHDIGGGHFLLGPHSSMVPALGSCVKWPYFTHEPRAGTMELWEPKRNCPKAIPTWSKSRDHDQSVQRLSQMISEFLWRGPGPSSVKSYATGPSMKLIYVPARSSHMIEYNKSMVVRFWSAMFCVRPTSKRGLLKIVQVTMKHDLLSVM